MEDFGGISLRGHQGDLLASGPALVFVLHLPMRCGSRTSGECFYDSFTSFLFIFLVRPVHVDIIVSASLSLFLFFNLVDCSDDCFFCGACNRRSGGGAILENTLVWNFAARSFHAREGIV